MRMEYIPLHSSYAVVFSLYESLEKKNHYRAIVFKGEKAKMKCKLF